MAANDQIVVLFKIKDLPIDQKLDTHQLIAGFHRQERCFLEVCVEACMGYGACGVGAFVNKTPVRKLEPSEVLSLAQTCAPEKYAEVEEFVRTQNRIASAYANATRMPNIENGVLKAWKAFDWESGNNIADASVHAHLLCSIGYVYYFYLPEADAFYAVAKEGNYYHGYETCINRIDKPKVLEMMEKFAEYCKRQNNSQELERMKLLIALVKKVP